MFRLRKELFFFRFQSLNHGIVVEPKNSPRGPRLQYRERSDRMPTLTLASSSLRSRYRKLSDGIMGF